MAVTNILVPFSRLTTQMWDGRGMIWSSSFVQTFRNGSNVDYFPLTFFTADYASFHLWASNFHQFRSELNQPFLSVFRHNLKPNNKLKLQVASC